MLNFKIFCNSHLYQFLNEPGSVIGKEKTRKGIPDSYIPYEGGYIFVEYTTPEKLEVMNLF